MFSRQDFLTEKINFKSWRKRTLFRLFFKTEILYCSGQDTVLFILLQELCFFPFRGINGYRWFWRAIQTNIFWSSFATSSLVRINSALSLPSKTTITPKIKWVLTYVSLFQRSRCLPQWILRFPHWYSTLVMESSLWAKCMQNVKYLYQHKIRVVVRLV